MRILYLGDLEVGGTSLHRCQALRRIGHDVIAFSPKSILSNNSFYRRFCFKSGYCLAALKIERSIKSYLGDMTNPKFDLVWVDNGEAVSRGLLLELKKYAKRLVNYNCDDPTGRRDGLRWWTLLRALPEYDLCAVVRNESEVEYPKYGAKRVIKVWRSADEVAHSPYAITPEIYEKWKSDVAFVGTWMPERGPFMLELIRAGIPLSIWGGRWQKDPKWSKIKSFWRGDSLIGNEYVFAIQCSRINLGLLSKGNRDLHTTRTAEIPNIGSLLCAENTVEHADLFENHKEALLWDNALDCAELIKYYLANQNDAERIAREGQKVIKERGLLNEKIMNLIINSL